MRGSVALIVVTAACYAPDVEDCQYQCNDETGCPDGLACSPDGMCRADPTSTTCPLTACAWDYAPSNFDPCDPYIAQGGPPWDIRNTLPYQTGEDVAGAPPPRDVGDVRLIRVSTLSIAPGATLELLGPRVVIIIADSVSIGGEIIARSGTAAADCVAIAGDPGQCGGGGAGGAFQGSGGGGGACSNFMGGAGGLPTPALAPVLVPLRRGCDGALGGASLAGNGTAGGGLQIAARFELKVTGTSARIVAPGRGATGGMSDAPVRNGGNGGGSGGAILLEAATLNLSSLVCAEGGGGGEGMNSASSTSFGANGTDGCLAAMAHLGGTSALDGGDGGDGGAGATLDGANGMTNSSAGGGGGGGAGVIRVHTLDRQDGGATYSPAPIVE